MFRHALVFQRQAIQQLMRSKCEFGELKDVDAADLSSDASDEEGSSDDEAVAADEE